ncbi:MAG: hypothetical protein K2M91_07405 [Lachnospiraceae bacterium]|nr:hypothetical protein [Lachnospiraceae bacterium]
MDKDKLQNAEWSLDFMITQSIEKLRGIMLNYDIFSSIAEKLEWLDMEEQYEEWRQSYLGIGLEVFKFPQDYIILNHIEDVYVRVALSTMAHYEGWEPQFWNILQEERKLNLKEKGMLYMYENYVAFKDLRLVKRDWTYLANEIQFFANENEIPISYQKQYLDTFENAKVIELGGDYSGDASYWAMKRNKLLVVSCGCWD